MLSVAFYIVILSVVFAERHGLLTLILSAVILGIIYAEHNVFYCFVSLC
jgi:hypothetical protein